MAEVSQLNIIILRENKMRTVTIVIMLLALCSQAYALSFMGPPRAELDQGQYSIGLDYAFSEMDIEFSGNGLTGTQDDVETNMIFANLGYGIAPNLEAFLRLGASKTEFDDYSSDAEFAYGFGFKATFAQEGDLTWGGLFQMTWLNSDDTSTLFLEGHTITGKQEFDVYEIQLSVGPTYETEGLSIYGGPFLHLVNGDYDWSGTVTGPIVNGSGSFSFDVEEESVFGGYIGLTKELTSNSNIGVEFQFTGDAQAVGLRFVHRF